MDVGKLFTFRGRIGRAAYWGLGILTGVVLAVAEVVVDASGTNAAVALGGVVAYVLGAVIWIASTVKRYHDRGKSGAWVFVVLIPLVGAVWSFVETCFLAGDEEANRYGWPSSGSPFGG
ncbi:MAG: hypothetical protein AVDCRST_MAG73-3335 [uncultured Thermomicrobiales bacterium]|uniref:DUF805 domain-containing protein n=1 Tax=uncultured Thermomicrobiales bacterium TaxID=1645740 RepID=A0A6J4UUN4_9BACT|nr:MAG: hypothetical protein AVDCRST_MAG73-3335 [uncultured Thermomicrobiales bacterium]